MTPAQRLARQKLSGLEKVPDAFINSLAAVNRSIYSRMEELLDQLDTTGGNIALTDSNLLLASQVAELVGQIATTPEYIEALTAFAQSFEQQADITDAYMQEVFGRLPEIGSRAQIINASRVAALEQLTGAALIQELGQPLQQQILASVQNGATKKEVTKFVKEFLEGGLDGKESRLKAYAGTIVDTTFSVFDRTYTQILSKDLGVEFYRYSGTIIKTTRQFCKDRAGKYFTTEEVKAWGNQNWAGRIEGTNENTIFAYCGGWNCRHSILPVAEKPNQ
jgi:hypothetical protein